MKTQARAENIISTASKLSSMLDEGNLDMSKAPSERPRTVESTLDVTGGKLEISQARIVSHQDPRSSREQGAGNVVNATPAALSLMRTMAPVSGSDPEALSAWATEAQGSAAFNVAMQSLSALSGGLSVDGAPVFILRIFGDYTPSGRHFSFFSQISARFQSDLFAKKNCCTLLQKVFSAENPRSSFIS